MPNLVHVQVYGVDDLLNSGMYDAGAVVRLEWCATQAGTYASVGTAALVTGDEAYTIYHPEGSSSTWYRTRYENAGGSVTSDYSPAFQADIHGLYLSVDQYRAFDPVPSLSDEALLVLLDAAAQAIIAAHGYHGATTEWLRGGRGPLLGLSRPALSVTSVTEDNVALAADDYELSASGGTLRRLSGGTNTRRWWGWTVDVAYLPRDDLAERQRVQRELVQLDITFQPGLAAQTIGTWSETYASATAKTYAEQRANILASMGQQVLIV